jgi:hypothetical protein
MQYQRAGDVQLAGPAGPFQRLGKSADTACRNGYGRSP